MDTISTAVGRVRRKMWLSGLLSATVWVLTGMIAAALVAASGIQRSFALRGCCNMAYTAAAARSLVGPMAGASPRTRASGGPRS